MESLYQSTHTPSEYYTNANTLLEEGRIKDAYSAYLSVVELSTQQLHKVKFVHQTLVSKPNYYEDSFALLRSSLKQIERITIHTLPGTTIIQSKSPPPVPPKPPTIQKPAIPPKPADLPIPARLKPKRVRGSSVSFADNPQLEEDDDDDEDIVIDFEHDHTQKRPFTYFTPHEPFIGIRSRSQSCVENTLPERNSIDVILDTVIDPSTLVPAQTNTGDSLVALPTTAPSNEYVPNIPAPPLLATHRKLQHRLNQLETDLDECKKQRQLKEDSMMDLMISERGHRVNTARDALNKVRTLYMSAMTIPNILQFSPHLTAYQLTLIESALFRDIPRKALLSHSTRTPHPKIVASTDFFNFVTRSIEHSILLPQEASKRADIISRWIKIATFLLSLNNFQTLKAVISALGTPPIQRLRKTWECVPKKRMGRLELMTTLMSECDNYRRYRECVGKKVWHQPVVPFIGVFMHDLTYLHAAMKGRTDARVQDVLNSVQQFQRAPKYPNKAPASYISSANKKKLFRPVIITNALHFSTKTNHRASIAGITIGDETKELTEIELQQQLIMQYLLMRPWVSERVIDALSTLREPAKSRSTTSSAISSTINLGMLYRPVDLEQSVMKFSNSSSNTLIDDTEDTRKTLTGFWPFRKSMDASNRTSLNTESLPDQSWSEDDDEEETESPPSEGGMVFHSRLNHHDNHSHTDIKEHPSSISLPSDYYH